MVENNGHGYQRCRQRSCYRESEDRQVGTQFQKQHVTVAGHQRDVRERKNELKVVRHDAKEVLGSIGL